jgi:hypothetical protein
MTFQEVCKTGKPASCEFQDDFFFYYPVTGVVLRHVTMVATHIPLDGWEQVAFCDYPRAEAKKAS